MSDLLIIKDLTYKKNQKTILKDVDLTLTSGKIVALLGENGAGKTTLMRIIAGVAKNYKGQIDLAGATKEAERKAKLSFTDGLTGFSDSTKIAQIVRFYATIFQDFDENEFDELRKFMKLDPEMKLSQLSRGMREKLIIAHVRQIYICLMNRLAALMQWPARRSSIQLFCGKTKILLF